MSGIERGQPQPIQNEHAGAHVHPKVGVENLQPAKILPPTLPTTPPGGSRLSPETVGSPVSGGSLLKAGVMGLNPPVAPNHAVNATQSPEDEIGAKFFNYEAERLLDDEETPDSEIAALHRDLRAMPKEEQHAALHGLTLPSLARLVHDDLKNLSDIPSAQGVLQRKLEARFGTEEASPAVDRKMFAGYETAVPEKRLEILMAFVVDCRKGAGAEKSDEELFAHDKALGEMQELLRGDQEIAKQLKAKLQGEMQKMQETTRDLGGPLKVKAPLLYSEFTMLQDLINTIDGAIRTGKYS